jgi:hypothetical protein
MSGGLGAAPAGGAAWAAAGVLDDEEAEAEAALGLVGGQIRDGKWEDTLEAEIVKLQAAYGVLAVPVTGGLVLNMVSWVVGIVLVTMACVVVVAVSTVDFQPTTASLMLSGLPSFILSLIQLFIPKVRYPSSELETSPPIEFPRATNPSGRVRSTCWRT